MMHGFSAIRTLWYAAAFLGVLALLRYEPWRAGGSGHAGGSAPRERLTVGYLPVT